MQLLVLGGSVFLSRAVARAAVAAGHDVVCATRGRSGPVPDGARHVVWDRAAGSPPSDLADLRPDAVVDVSRTPSHVRAAVAAWPGAHGVFVSTINVYADDATPGGGPGTTALREPLDDDVDPASSPEAYGAMKVACEEHVRAGAATSAVVRPGLIVGPDDPTGRFTYWPVRLADRDRPEVLAPGRPDDVVQVLDVRDLADWLVHLAEQRTPGTFDAVGWPVPLGTLLDHVAAGVDVAPAWRWVPQERLAELGVQPWAGEHAVPLWLPRPEHDGMLAHRVEPALAAGLRLRPLAETARDTLAWVRATPDAVVTGLDADAETAVLAGRPLTP